MVFHNAFATRATISVLFSTCLQPGLLNIVVFTTFVQPGLPDIVALTICSQAQTVLVGKSAGGDCFPKCEHTYNS